MAPTLQTMSDVLAGDDSSPALLVGSGGATYTRGQLRALVHQFAASLRASGVQPGQVVTIAEPNTVRGRRRLVCACRCCACVGECVAAPSGAGGKLPCRAPFCIPFTCACTAHLNYHPPQVEYVVAFLGATLARAVAAPLNQNYKTVRLPCVSGWGTLCVGGSVGGTQPSRISCQPACMHACIAFLQEEFQFYMEDAGSRLLVVGPGGNPAAQAAGGPPCLALAVAPADGAGGAPRISVESRTEGWEARLGEAAAALQVGGRAGRQASRAHGWQALHMRPAACCCDTAALQALLALPQAGPAPAYRRSPVPAHQRDHGAAQRRAAEPRQPGGQPVKHRAGE